MKGGGTSFLNRMLWRICYSILLALLEYSQSFSGDLGDLRWFNSESPEYHSRQRMRRAKLHIGYDASGLVELSYLGEQEEGEGKLPVCTRKFHYVMMCRFDRGFRIASPVLGTGKCPDLMWTCSVQGIQVSRGRARSADVAYLVIAGDRPDCSRSASTLARLPVSRSYAKLLEIRYRCWLLGSRWLPQIV